VDEPSPRAAAVVLRLFRICDGAPELSVLRASLGRGRPFDNASVFDERIAPPESSAACRRRKRLVRLSSARPCYTAGFWSTRRRLLGWERGLGKSVGTAALIDEMDCQRILIVCRTRQTQCVGTRACAGSAVGRSRCTSQPRRSESATWGYVKQLAASGQQFCAGRPLRGARIVAGSSGKGWARLGLSWDIVVGDEIHRIAILRPRRSA